MGYIEGKVDKWYGNTDGALWWDDRQTLIEMVAECVIASMMDSSIGNEALEIAGVSVDGGGIGNVKAES